ncbi:hypothetical protein JCM10908_002260 [Rhodotorula pacifica]|uniref:uncharacterized protein n=1 Tax=Rhodotorula pacifica TaxID=1495444 RepID=UPI00317191FB
MRTAQEIKATIPWLFPRPDKVDPVYVWHIMDQREDWDICGVSISPSQFWHGGWQPTKPTLCTAFLIDHSVLYASGVNYIPDSEWKRLNKKLALPSQDGLYDHASSGPRLQVAVLDATSRFAFAKTHFSLGQAIGTARRLGAMRTVLTGIPHGFTHKSWYEWCRAFGKHQGTGGREMPPLWWDWPEETKRAGTLQDTHGDPWATENFMQHATESVRLWETENAVYEPAGGSPRLHGIDVRPAFDGMTFSWDPWHGGQAHVGAFDPRVKGPRRHSSCY